MIVFHVAHAYARAALTLILRETANEQVICHGRAACFSYGLLQGGGDTAAGVLEASMTAGGNRSNGRTPTWPGRRPNLPWVHGWSTHHDVGGRVLEVCVGVYALERTSNMPATVENFFTEVGAPVVCFHSGIGGKCYSRQYGEICDRHGIRWAYPPVDTPELHAVVESGLTTDQQAARRPPQGSMAVPQQQNPPRSLVSSSHPSLSYGLLAAYRRLTDLLAHRQRRTSDRHRRNSCTRGNRNR